MPDFSSGKYSAYPYGLGFFAGIAVTVSNVNIYLTGHKMEQSPEHALMQRFYAHIELGSAPFIANAGPHNFVAPGDIFHGVSNVSIHGPGMLGRTSHHGIHGNNANNVIIDRVTFGDFEVAAVGLNLVNGLKISNCHVTGTRTDVPVLAMFSAARFIR